MLRDERYTGTYIAGKTKNVDVGSSAVIKLPESEWHRIPDHHPAIIDKPLYDAVRAAIDRKSASSREQPSGNQPRNYTSGNPLKGKVVCGCCNHAMKLSNTKNTRFKCNFTRNTSDAECHGLSVSAHELADMLYDVVSKQAQAILDVGSPGDIAELDQRMARQSEIAKQIESCQNEKCSLYESLILGTIDTDAYKAAKAAIDLDLNRLHHAHATIASENETLSTAKATNDALRNAALSASGESTLTHTLVDALISKVYI